MELQERIERLERLIGGNGVDDENGKRLTGEEALAWMDGRGFSILLGLTNLQTALSTPTAPGAQPPNIVMEVAEGGATV